MVATFSPHRDAGGTLHLPSPSGMHHVDAGSAIRQLRRSLSRSPSKSSDFRLLPSRAQNTTPFISSPLSPSRRASHGNLFLVSTGSSSNQSPFAIPHPSSAKITRPTMRRTGPLPATRTRTSPKSPTKRALNPLTDQGNATPAPPVTLAPGEENVIATPAVVPAEETNNRGPDDTAGANASTENILPPDGIMGPKPTLSRVEKRRSEIFGGFSSTASPLKRSDGIMGLDQVSRGSPSAKRRSVHSASFGADSDFSIFDNMDSTNDDDNDNDEGGQSSAGEPTEESANENDAPSSSGPAPSPLFSPLADVPKRSSSLRRSTLQQRQSLFSKPRTNLDQPDSPATSPAPTIRPRMSLDSNLFQQSGRDSPFVSSNTSGGSLFSSNRQKDAPHAAHPLSRTITQSSSGSSLADDSPTHEPVHKPERPRAVYNNNNNNNNFSKSLPVGATRPGTGREFTRHDSTSSTDSFATPENYKLVKPLPAAFMSTGLISKKNRNLVDAQGNLGFNKHMPDTPCKRSINMLPTAQKASEKPKLVRQSFAAPSSPFNPQTTRPSSGPFARGMGIFGSNLNKPELSRRSSFVSVDGDDTCQSPSARHDSPYMSDSDLPPTPTKQAFFPSRTYPLAGTQLASLDKLSESKGSTCKFSPIGASPLGTEEDSDSMMDDSPSANLSFKSSHSTLPPPSCLSHRRPVGDFYSPSPHSRKNVAGVPSAQVGHAKTGFVSAASPLNNKFERASPRTPQEHILPPDPSGLSISGPNEQPLAKHDFDPAALPATPTGPRDYFPQTGKRPSLSLSGYSAPDVDISLTSRFDKVELIGTGEFSQVYRVSQSQQNTEPCTSIFSLPSSATKPPTERVWAVKKSKQPYAGAKDRERRLREVEALKALTNSDHIITFVDSWEDKGHLYIQTEFCEEGSLDVFLAQVGLKARLDDFRIWKILLELSLV